MSTTRKIAVKEAFRPNHHSGHPRNPPKDDRLSALLDITRNEKYLIFSRRRQSPFPPLRLAQVVLKTPIEFDNQALGAVSFPPLRLALAVQKPRLGINNQPSAPLSPPRRVARTLKPPPEIDYQPPALLPSLSDLPKMF